MLPDTVHNNVERLLSAATGETVRTERTTAAGGGCINDAHHIHTSRGTFFVKYNSASRYPGMFGAEARGLRLLGDAHTLRVPAVIGWGGPEGIHWTGNGDGAINREEAPESGDYAFLVLECIQGAPRQHGFWEAFGEGLAKLHRNRPTDRQFGLDHDNYIGSLPQHNGRHREWTAFFAAERLEPQVRMARDGGRADATMVQMFERLYGRLEDFFPEEPPALVHGDLWSGNFMTGDQGEAVVIDPAAYYGHRYMDLGMSRLFGGFDEAFYRAYDDAHPLEKGWKEGLDIANLYPLMVHVNLFGGGYAGSVRETLRRFA